MATAALSDSLWEELTCSICLQVYTDPVILTCNHSFCRACIEDLWKDTHSGFFCCPQCRKWLKVRPLEKNFQLANIIQKYKGQTMSQAVILCSYCTKQQIPAVKTCLKCEVAMCSIHLKSHQENLVFESHPLRDPFVNATAGKCTEHQELLKLYCKDDNVCICSLCALAGDHKGHNLISISEAVKELKNNLENQQSMIRKNIISVQGTLDVLQKEKKSSLLMRGNMRGPQRIMRWLGGCENKSDYASKVLHLLEYTLKLSGVVKSAVQMHEMMNKTGKSIQEKYKTQREQIDKEEWTAVQQLTIEQSRVTAVIHGRILTLQHQVKEFEKSLTELNHLAMNEDILFIQVFHSIAPRMNKLAKTLDKSTIDKMIKYPMEQKKELWDRGEMVRLYGQTPTLDPDTAHPSLILFDNNSTVLGSLDTQPYPDSPHRIDGKQQVLCSVGISYGRSYWEVKTSKEVGWKVGVCYRSINRKGQGNECALGQNDKSWCVQPGMFSFLALHNRIKTKRTKVKDYPNTVGVFVDFDCGIISFYSVSDDMLTLLYTFEQTFLQPLYPALEITGRVIMTILTMG